MAGGRRDDEAARPRRRLPACRDHPDERPPRRLRDARRRRQAHPRPLLHVRRQAGRPRRVELAALGREARRDARRRHGADGPRAPPTRKARRPRSSPRMHAIRGAGKKMPVNLVLVAEGEEEVGSPNFPRDLSCSPRVRPALETLDRHLHAAAHAQEMRRQHLDHARFQGRHGNATSSPRGEAWGRGPSSDVHSSIAACLDQPAWHLVQALNSLVTAEWRSRQSTGSSSTFVRSAPKSTRCSTSPAQRHGREDRFSRDIGAKVWARNAEFPPGE